MGLTDQIPGAAAHIDETVALWLARGLGAVAGSAISIAYILPSGRREAAVRFAVGLACGLTFGGGAGVKIAAELEVGTALGAFEAMLIGSAAASLCAWWALGFLMRIFGRDTITSTKPEAKP